MQNNEKYENLIQSKKSIKAPLIKVVLIGESGVGKTTMIHCYVSNEKVKEDYKQSVGIDYLVKKIKLKSDLTIRFEIVTLNNINIISGILQEMKNLEQ